jgi:hypothetical protein
VENVKPSGFILPQWDITPPPVLANKNLFVMTKRNATTETTIQDPTLSKSKKPKIPRVTLESDPTISTDHAKIASLLWQKKSWRSVPRFNSILTAPYREIANYFSDYNAETIKKRYNLCRKVLMETFTPEDVLPYRSRLIFRMQN